MPRTKSVDVELQSEVTIMETEPKIKQIFRGVSRTPISTSGADTVDVVEAYINSYLAQGYKVVNTHVLEVSPEYIYMLYVLAS